MKTPVAFFSLTAMLASFVGPAAAFPQAKVAASHPSTATVPKSAKRGVAYDLATPADIAAVAPGVSWWYNWASTPNTGIAPSYYSTYGMTYYPMLWNGSFNKASVEAFIEAHPEIKYLLVLNEPNVSGQATCGNNTGYCKPADAAALWPQYESIASDTGVQIVGPQITYGTDPTYSNPETWLDAFIAAYQAANGGRSPRMDYLGFHWYDYGLATQLNNLDKYGKQIWVTEFANWHSQNDGAEIDTLAGQEAQMTDMVNTCETRADVFRYAWFTGRVSPDPHYDSLLAANGKLTALGQEYLTLPVASTSSSAASPVEVDAGSPTAQASYAADADFTGGAEAGSTATITLPSGDTASQAVYQTNRYGNFTYTLPGFPAGSTHTVRLHFAETYWSQAGQRVFNVVLNGTTVLPKFDIVATAGGAEKAVVESFSTVANSSGQIVIQFSTVADNAQVNGIEVH